MEDRLGMKIDRIPTESRIVFNVTVRNAVERIDHCLQSIEEQNSNRWMCIITDDASEDGTAKKIEEFTYNKPNYVPILNSSQKWKMENFRRALDYCELQDIVVELDGDDYLSRSDFVEDLIRLHTQYDVVWTQHGIDDSLFPEWHNWRSTTLPDDWSRITPYRETVFSPKMYPGHIRTFKKKYFGQINPKDLLYRGEPLQATSDVAYFTPIIEMAHPSLRYFYEKECAIYNIVEQNDTLFDRRNKRSQRGSNNNYQLQSDIGKYIKQLPPYSVIPIIHRIFFIPDQDFDKFYSIAMRYAMYEPFSKIHLFALSNHSAKKLMSLQRVPNMFVYDFDYIVNNSLSMVQDLLQRRINITLNNARNFYTFCIKYISTHFFCGSIFLYPLEKIKEQLIDNQILNSSLQFFDKTFVISRSINSCEDESSINNQIKADLFALQLQKGDG